MGDPCENFRLDYFLEGKPNQPNARYCACGWTEAHHEAPAEGDDE